MQSPPEFVRAAVVAGGQRTEYLATGRGATLLLLASEPRRSIVMSALGAAARVIAPVQPDLIAAGLGPEWLDGFLEGLGVPNVVLVADPESRALASEIGSRRPERVRRVVYLPKWGRGTGDGGREEGWLAIDTVRERG